MKTLCIIPARSGSKAIKDKNIQNVGGKNLFIHSLEFAKKLKFVNQIVFSSDSNKYIKIASKIKKIFISKRPKKFSTDKSLMVDVIKYELNKQKQLGKFYDFVLILQPTCPFRRIKDFEKAFRIIKKKYFDTIISISRTRDHPDRLKVFRNNKLVNYNKKLSKENLNPRQNLESIFIRSGSMYLFNSKLLKKNLIVGKKVYGILVEGKYSINIDNKEDLILARYYSEKKNL